MPLIQRTSFALIGAFVFAHSASAQAPLVSSVQRIEELTYTIEVLNPGTLPTRSEFKVTTADSPCGPTRVCGASFALRVRRVQPPAVMAANTPTSISFVIENAGKLASPAVDVAICAMSSDRCERKFDIVTLPELKAGQVATVLAPIEVSNLGDVGRSFTFGVMLDPDHILPPTAVKSPTKTAEQSTEIEGFNVEMLDSDGRPERTTQANTSERFWSRLRNSARLATMPSFDIKLVLSDMSFPCMPRKAVSRTISIPSLPPGSSVRLGLDVPTAMYFGRCKAGEPGAFYGIFSDTHVIGGQMPANILATSEIKLTLQP